MDESREHARVAYGIQVEFRTTSSFLVAYSINISRGGMFLETKERLPIGSEIALQLHVPDALPVNVTGRVTWHRGEDHPEGPAGMGVEFQEISALAGEFIDDLVSSFTGLTILLLCDDDADRSVLTRQIRSVFSTAQVLVADMEQVASSLVDNAIDLLVVDVDANSEAAVHSLRLAAQHDLAAQDGLAAQHDLAAQHAPAVRRVPSVALAGSERLRLLAHEAGADEIGSNPPQFREFHKLLIRAMGRPSRVGPSR